MKNYNFILASASPRRKELLSIYIKDFKIITVETEDQRIEKIGCSKKALKHLEQLKITHDLF